jgi:hypothetical protein
MRDERYLVDHLFLLVGTNPLPNYVAAKLLLRDPKGSQVFLVFSRGTETARAALERELQKEQYSQIMSVEVEEANPAHIRKTLTEYALGLTGLVGLNYTGGTKAMAVHSYLAIQALTKPPNGGVPLRAQYSYLDSRTLRMQIEGDGVEARGLVVDVRQHVQLPLQKLLDLHKLTKLKQQMSRTTVWGGVAESLAYIHSEPEGVQLWREWCRQYLRRPENESKFVNTSTLMQVSTDTIPFATVRDALKQECPTAIFPCTFGELAAHSPFKKTDERFARWLDGAWLEHYVFSQLQPLLQSGELHDLAMTLNPLLGDDEKEDPDFEFDVGCTRGYQLFALSVTSSSNEKLGKRKLLEALVRAEQLGGSEARVALVCCYDRPARLHTQVSELFHRSRSRVFGPANLPDLAARLAAWITNASDTQE